MSKYAPLESYLSRQKTENVSMTFRDIEKVIGSHLPSSARAHRPWWGNNATGHVNARAWLRAGYRTENVDMSAERLTFRRIPPNAPQPGSSSPAASPAPSAKPFPLHGALRDMVRYTSPVSLTEPAGERWDAESDEA